MAKSKSPKGKKGKGKTPRDPYNSKLKRGLKTDAEVAGEKEKREREEALKKFGPCHFDANECMTAILMLQSEEDHIVIGALNCLQKFLKKQTENCEIFAELHGIAVLARLIHSNNPVIQRMAMKCMAIASKAHKAKLAVRDTELVQDFNNFCQSLDETMQEYASLCMSNLATLYTGRLQLIQNGSLPILLKLLEHPDADVIRNAIEAIWRILEEPLNIQFMLSEEVLKPIVDLIDSEFPTVQVIAMSVLQKVAQLPSGTNLLDKMGLIENISGKLDKMEWGDLHRVALKTLINMAQSKPCCTKMSGLIGHLMNVINLTSDEKTLSHAIKLAGKISCVASNASLLIDSGFGEKLVELLACDNMKLVAAAAMAAAQISACDARAMKILTKAMESLLDYAESPDITMQGFESVMATLSHVLASGKPAGHLFLEWGGKDTLIKMLTKINDYSDDALISAMTCIHNLSLHWALRPHFADDSIISGILAIMDKTSNPQLLVAAATALTGLMCEHQALVTMVNKDGIKMLIKLIQHDEYPVIASAVPIIHVAGTYEDIAFEIVEHGVLEELWKRQDLISVNGPFRTGFERLLCSNLSAKFSIAGHLDPFEKLPDGFYDYGAVKNAEDIVSVSKMVSKSKTNSDMANPKKILYLNLTKSVRKELTESNPIFTEMINKDFTVQNILEEIMGIIDVEGSSSEGEVLKVIARVVSDRLGGPVDKLKVSYESEELELANLETQFTSVVVPITMLSAGSHRPRAILFKALTDAFGIPCSLDRGGYRKVWNVVLIRSQKCDKPCICTKPSEASLDCDGEKKQAKAVYSEKLRRYVVDLVHQPGTLLPFHSYEANAYCFF
ncbi:unnamed protein product [Allacma fusca]|uniref:EDR1/CTR1/ARMC3-like peptidase-like domain-containing protein n=1 Tax=Allacma fusca TaxID=39272 RepID=A0A8J2LJ39_9HEXA|nr:unnamed protein product [Allacma fusca]